MNITILGAGAMGSFFGGLLAEKGYAVTLLDINHLHIEAINNNGLCLEINNEKRYIKNIKASNPSEAAGRIDLLIIFTKSTHTDEALKSISSLISENTKVLTLQNGLGNLEKINKYIDIDNIIIGITTWPADYVKEGYISSHGQGEIRLTSANNINDKNIVNIVNTLNSAGLNCKLDEDVWGAIWEKLAFNCALNSLCAVTNFTVDQLALIPEGKFLALKIADEVLSVAIGIGIVINSDRVHATILDAIANHKGHKPSMLQDIEKSRTTEISALNGAVVAKAIELDIAVYYTNALLILVELIETKYTYTRNEAK